MNGLSTATVTMIYIYAAVSLLALGAALAVTMLGWPGLGSPMRLTRALCTGAAWLTASLAGFLERATADIWAGLLNGMEWLVYGPSQA